MSLFVGNVFPYLAIAVFAGGMTWRTAYWLRKPVPYPLAVDRDQRGIAGQAGVVAAELLLFRSLYRGDRRLWRRAALMHASLAAIVIGHVVGISCSSRQFTVLGVSAATSVSMAATLGVVFGLLLTVSVLALLRRRIAVPEVRRISDPADYFDLLLLLAIAATGLMMRLLPLELDQQAVRSYLGGLLTLSPVPIPGPWPFVCHFTLVSCLLAYLPFSKLVHLSGGVVSRALLLGPPRATSSPPSPKPDCACLAGNRPR